MNLTINSQVEIEYSMPRVQYAIVKHIPRRPFNIERDYDPDTVPVQDVASGTGKGETIQIFDDWWEQIRRINNDDGYAYARSVGAMWINIPYDDTTTARAESIICGGNFVAFDKMTSTHGHMLTFSNRANINDVNSNWLNYPHMYFKAIAINEYGMLRNVGDGIDCFLPNLRVTDRWINLSYVELFPSLPFNTYYFGHAMTIVSYKLQGASVLGITSEGETIYLLKSTQPNERSFLTTWRLATVGVIPPA